MKPKTLQQAVLYFTSPDNCFDYMISKRWPDGVVTCPTCGRRDVTFLKTQRKWQCKSAHAKRQFSAKVGTIFEDSPIPLEKWLVVVWMLCNCKNGVSSYEISARYRRYSEIRHGSCCIGFAWDSELFGTKIGGSGGAVEIDETFVGGRSPICTRERKQECATSKGRALKGDHHGQNRSHGNS